MTNKTNKITSTTEVKRSKAGGKIAILLEDVLHEMIENDEMEQRILKEIGNVLMGRQIDVNDGDDGDGSREYDFNVGSRIYAHLVIEEDGEINWYLNPDDRSDYVLFAIPVEKKQVK